MQEQSQLSYVPIEKLQIAELNVRKAVGDVSELADSIRVKGVLQPLLVRPNGSKFEVIVGSRRFTAAKKVGLKQVPVIIKTLNDEDALIESLAENIQRNNLEPNELGEAINLLRGRFDYTEQRVGKVLGISENKVSSMIRSYELLVRLESAGKKVSYRPSAEDRATKGSIPYWHVVAVQRAFDNEDVKRVLKKLPEKERAAKEVQLAEAVAPMTQFETEKVLDYFKMYPEKPVQEAVSKGIAKVSGVALRAHLTPSAARKIEEFADKKGVSSDEVLPDLIEKGLESFVTAKDLMDREPSGPTQQREEREPRDVGKHWAEDMEQDPLPVQIGNWYRWNAKRTGKFDFFTAHYSGKDPETMIGALKAAGVRTLVDVRATPFSQFRPEFNKERFSKALEAQGVGYLHIPELGVPKAQREQLAKSGDWTAFFRWYDLNTIPTLKSEMKGGRLSEAAGPLAFMCLEKDPEKCHRHRIALALEKQDMRSMDL